VHKPFNRYDDKGARADLNVVFAWQSGHRPIQRAATYGLDGAFPTTLQPALLRVYEWASTRWHGFLHQPSKVMPQQKKTKATEKPQEGRRSLHDNIQLSQAEATTDRTRERNYAVKDLKRRNSNENPWPAKRRSVPWLQKPSYADLDTTRLENEPDTTRPAKQRAMPGRQDLPRADNIPLAQNQARFLGIQDHATLVAKQPAYPTDIIARVKAWKDGAGGKPVSDDEGDSLIDWDELDMIPSAAPTDGSLPSWSRAPWPSWSRHNTRIEAKIDKARQFHGVFDVKELRQHEQIAMRDLKRCLDLWSKYCIVCDFKGNPGGHHSTQDCPDRLYRTVQTWAPAFQARLQQLAVMETQHCPMCLVPKLICSR
jgi:hypothetical protein